MNILLVICIALAAGLMMTRLMKLIGLPNVTGYLIIGIILGPCCLKIISQTDINGVFDIITEVALAFIAFSIGVEFKISAFKRIGKNIFIITLSQALTTAVLVDVVLITLALTTDIVELPVAICLGAIATATAPAATRKAYLPRFFMRKEYRCITMSNSEIKINLYKNNSVN